MPGWITKWAFEAGALAADTQGRAAMADGYIQGAKVEAGTLTIDKLDSALLTVLSEPALVDEAIVDLTLVAP